MTIRFSRLRLALIATLAVLASATRAQAQVSRDWSVCFGSGVSSCTDLFLTTTPTLGGLGGARDGTMMSLTVRQRDRGLPTALFGFALGFGPGSVDQGDALSTIPTGLGGAQTNPSGRVWYLDAYRSTSAFGLNYLSGIGETDQSQSPTPTAWIGGCLSPSSEVWWTVDNRACGSGQAFSFLWNTPVFFDADQVETVGVDVVSGDQQSLFNGTGGGYCRGSASDGAGVGFDGYDPSNAFPCEIGGAESFIATVPEPQTVVLLAGGLALLGGWRRRGLRLRGARLRRRAV